MNFLFHRKKNSVECLDYRNKINIEPDRSSERSRLMENCERGWQIKNRELGELLLFLLVVLNCLLLLESRRLKLLKLSFYKEFLYNDNNLLTCHPG